MSTDRYSRFVGTLPGRLVARNAGLPQPVTLDRYVAGARTIDGTVLLGAATGGRLSGAIARTLAGAGADAASEMREDLRSAAAAAGLDAAIWNPQAPGEQRFKALVFDASGIDASDRLGELHAFLHATLDRLETCARVIVLATPPEQAASTREHTAQRALEGITRSVGKEVGRGGTAQLVYVAPGAEDAIDSTLRFLLSPRSAYVSGQVVRIAVPVTLIEADSAAATAAAAATATAADPEHPLSGRVALVTGASRGIGAAIARVLERDGAHVIGLEVPQLADELTTESVLAIDVTAPDAPQQISTQVNERFAGVDIVVHNAGITRDRMLKRMDPERFAAVIDVNLSSQERINSMLLDQDVLRPGGRLIGVSSIAGIAGNSGQVNYAASKAGVIGMVEALAPQLAARGATINAVAPGFIETQMTAAVPLVIREAGRRMNSLSQGGLPIDVAETIAWFAAPGSAGVNGNVVRVCGQSLLGA